MTDKVPAKLDQLLCFAVYSTAHAFNRAYKPLLADLGLTYPQYLVMLLLWEEAPRTVTAIGDRLELDSGTLTPLLKRLEAAGLVTRSRNAKDERQVLVELTAQGKALRRKAAAVPDKLACAIVEPAEKIQRMRRDLSRLRDALRESVP